MITEYEVEPIPGLPGLLPPGETIVWQGRPDRAMLARGAFHVRLVAGYFAILVAIACVAALAGGGGWLGIGLTLAAGGLALGVLHLLAWATARSTIYTLTNRRVVMRVGVALPKCVNLPLGVIGAVDLSQSGDGIGDIALAISARQQIGWIGLWPHARAWRLAEPQPMLRAVPNAVRVGAMIAQGCRAMVEPSVIPIAPRTPHHPVNAAVAA